MLIYGCTGQHVDGRLLLPVVDLRVLLLAPHPIPDKHLPT